MSRRRRFYSQEKRGTAWKKMGGNGHYSRNFAWDVLRKKNIKIYFSFFLSPLLCVCSSCYAEFRCWAKCHEVKLCVSGYFFLLLVANWNSKMKVIGLDEISDWTNSRNSRKLFRVARGKRIWTVSPVKLQSGIKLVLIWNHSNPIL